MTFFGACRSDIRPGLSQEFERLILTAYTNSGAHIDFQSSMLGQLITACYFDGTIDGRHHRVSCRRVSCRAICSVEDRDVCRRNRHCTGSNAGVKQNATRRRNSHLADKCYAKHNRRQAHPHIFHLHSGPRDNPQASRCLYIHTERLSNGFETSNQEATA